MKQKSSVVMACKLIDVTSWSSQKLEEAVASGKLSSKKVEPGTL